MIYTDTQSDPPDLDKICIRQSSTTFNGNIDGIRVATSWDNAPLPVELTDFNATWSQGVVKLDWTTATEVNNYGFNIERSNHLIFDEKLKEWIVIGFVSGHGNCNSIKCYTFTDSYPFHGKNIYRLKQIDTDGNYTYSQQVSVIVPVDRDIKFLRNYPNPFNPATIIEYYLPEKSHVKLILYDITGSELCLIQDGVQEEGIVKTILNFNDLAIRLPSGVYIIKLVAADVIKYLKIAYVK